jgi:ABC-type polysaccharide/polyol phosphate transport system ATPase subunit
MDAPLIGVDGVGKKFCRSLRRSLWYGVKDLSGEMLGRGGRRDLRRDEFWAVDGVSFRVDRGETVGLIGHNGAGKTTLLRMLCGLIRPDRGRIEVNGQVQALIALGAGFSPLLTGRENIYVNASILGVPRPETDRLFDRIVEFAGVQEAIDMPVQSYSSGMTVRLGFAIAAHLEPDILLVDEVLSVGDLAFRTKCQVRIQEMKERGVSIVLVSHNLHTISHICTRAVTLDRGRVIFDGDTEGAIDAYRDSLVARDPEALDSVRAGTGEIRVRAVEAFSGGDPRREVEIGEPVTFRVHYTAERRVEDPVFNLAVHVMNGHQVTGIRTDMDGLRVGAIEPGEGHIDVQIPQFNLLPNVYTVDAVLFHQDGVTFYDRLNHAATLKVRGGLAVHGTCYLPHAWQRPRPAPAVEPASPLG